jgi:hypothetical protein
VSAEMKAVYERPLQWNEGHRFSQPVRGAAGLVFRVNEKGCYALLVSPSAEHKRKLAFEVVARTFQGDSFAEAVIVPWTTVEGASATEAHLVVENVGDQIAIFVDGQQVGTVRDDTYTDGYAGFMVSAPAQATFSNFLVEQTSVFHPATSVALAQTKHPASDSGQAAAVAPPVVGATLASAGDKPWMSKPYDAWNEKDIQSILTQSPWVQTTTIRRTWLPVSEKDVAPGQLISGGIRQWPRDAPNLTGDSPAVMVRESEASTSLLNVDVYWDSSRVMRAAFARQSVLRGEIKESDAEAYVHAALTEYAIKLTMADMTPFQQNDEKFFQRQAFLEMRTRGRQLSPSHVVYQRDAKGRVKEVVFFFPKATPSGEPAITPDERDIEFKCQIADSSVHVGFSPQKMTDQAGGRDL